MSIAATVALQTAQLAAQVLIKPKHKSAIQNITTSNGALLITQDPFYGSLSPKTIVADALVEERHMDRLEVTTHPVETGAAITDHAFYHPPELTLVLGWSNSAKPSKAAQAADVAAAYAATLGGVGGEIAWTVIGAAQAGFNILTGDPDVIYKVYADLLGLLQNRYLFDVQTKKRLYKNMICKGLSTETDVDSVNQLIIVMECQQLLLVDTQVVTIDANKQANAKDTASTSNLGTQDAVTTPLAPQSALPTLTAI